MKSFIFITTEGFTYQPNSESIEPDIENCQVVGFAEGKDLEEAFGNLIAENEYLREINFNEIIGYELKYKNYHKFSKTFYINEKHKMLED